MESADLEEKIFDITEKRIQSMRQSDLQVVFDFMNKMEERMTKRFEEVLDSKIKPYNTMLTWFNKVTIERKYTTKVVVTIVSFITVMATIIGAVLGALQLLAIGLRHIKIL